MAIGINKKDPAKTSVSIASAGVTSALPSAANRVYYNILMAGTAARAYRYWPLFPLHTVNAAAGFEKQQRPTQRSIQRPIQ
ncbi:MAG: hypothetical protein ACI9WS_001649 [Paraglaciecola psychrophila]|jgi:hypothetical protein